MEVKSFRMYTEQSSKWLLRVVLDDHEGRMLGAESRRMK